MRKILLFIIIFSMLANSGCIHRRLTIRSDPPGVTVYFNDKKIGDTPVEFDFMWYHESHRIRLEKEGYETIEKIESIKNPPELWIPIDLIAEVMPVRVEDYRELSYTLVPKVVEEEPVPKIESDQEKISEKKEKAIQQLEGSLSE